MAEGKYDIRVSQRTDYSQEFAYREDDGVTVIPLTGATAVGQVRRKIGTDLLVSFSITMDKPNGIVILALTDTQTAALPVGNLEYDVLMTLGGSTFVFLEGKVKVDGTVTEVTP